jgi:hypothetical protein
MTIQRLQLRITLQSDATFGRGDGVAGLVDEEIEHDDRFGLPYLRGRTLKGLLVEECANILYALMRQGNPALEACEQAARALFGSPGSTLADDGLLRVGHAQLPAVLRRAVQQDVRGGRLNPAQVLESLTAIRRQTAVDEGGAPKRESLRSMRVLLRELTLIADLTFANGATFDLNSTELALLAACALGLRRAGTGRNRGRGRLKDVQVWDASAAPPKNITPDLFKTFTKLVNPQATGGRA